MKKKLLRAIYYLAIILLCLGASGRIHDNLILDAVMDFAAVLFFIYLLEAI